MANSSSRHVFDILRLVASSAEPLRGSEISRKLGLSMTTAHRGLATLEATGYVARYQASARYVVGPVAQHLAHAFFARFALREHAMPFLRALAITTGETVSLMVPIGWHSVRIASVRGMKEVIHTGPLGEVRGLDDGAASLAILAALPDDEIGRFLLRIGDDARAAALRGMVEEVRRLGFAYSGAGLNPGFATTAVALRSSGDRAIGAVAIEGPVLDLARRQDPDHVHPWTRIIAELDQLIRTKPRLFASRYDHLEPDEVVLPSVTRPSELVPDRQAPPGNAARPQVPAR